MYKGENMKTSCEVTLKIPEDVLRKLIIVSESENRSLNNQILLLARNSIAYFERAKTKITPKQMAEVDISEYKTEKDD